MARYKASLDTPRPPDEVFAYLSDFSTTAEWDPGVVEAERLGDPIGQFGRYHHAAGIRLGDEVSQQFATRRGVERHRHRAEQEKSRADPGGHR